MKDLLIRIATEYIDMAELQKTIMNKRENKRNDPLYQPKHTPKEINITIKEMDNPKDINGLRIEYDIIIK